jgi:signal transduction histidine kinase
VRCRLEHGENVGILESPHHTTLVIDALPRPPFELPVATPVIERVPRPHMPTSALLLRAYVGRLIAAGRIVLAAISLVVVALDQTAASRWRFTSLIVIGAYLLGAIGQTAIVIRTLRSPRGLPGIEITSDIVFVAAIASLTGGTPIAVFSFFIFFVVAAGLRRAPRTVVITGVTYLLIFFATTAATRIGRIGAPLELHQIVARSLLLGSATVALTIFAIERDRLFSSLTSLANAPLTEWLDLDSALFGLLGAAIDLAPGSRVALVWDDAEEPWTNVALLDDELTVLHLSPVEAEEPQHLHAGDSFICARLASREPIVTRMTATGLTKSRGVPLSAALLDSLSPTPRSIVGVPAHGRSFSGYLLILDWETIPSDFVLRAEIVARQIASSLDIWMLSRHARDLAAREERSRVWRDLHDGVLQSLTGLALMLAHAEQMVETDAGEARRILADAASLVHDEQRDLRLSILEQKAAATSPDVIDDLHALLAQLARRLEHVWGLHVELDIDPEIAVGPGLAIQIARMIQEGLSNSARHGQSTHVRLQIRAIDDSLLVTIEDNGKGFPFVGTFTHSMLLERRMGPILLKDRVQRLRGTLDIRSAPTGVGLDIRIPLGATRLAG